MDRIIPEKKEEEELLGFHLLDFAFCLFIHVCRRLDVIGMYDRESQGANEGTFAIYIGSME